MPQEHTCVTAFWGQHQPIEALRLLLDQISPGGALSMSDATYWTLCALQREIERAIDDPPTDIPDHNPSVPSPWPAQDEAALRAAAQAFMAELVKDQYDVVPNGGHQHGNHKWLTSNGTEQLNPNAVESLIGGRQGHPIVAPGGVLPRVRNALDS